MKTRIKEFPLTLEEVRDLLKKENSKKFIWITLAISVILVLVAVVIWLAKKGCKDIEEHYEYFDDDSDESDDYDEYEDFDEDIYEDEEVEYVKIKDFMNYSEDEKVADSAAADLSNDTMQAAEEVNKDDANNA